MEIAPQSEQWSVIKKVVFRFVAAYLIAYFASSVLDTLGEAIGSGFAEPLIRWVGSDILTLKGDLKYVANGSGDTSYAYASTFTYFLLSVFAALIWSVADRKRTNYNRALYWVTVLVRYYLAFFLSVYGFSKFNHGQFPEPGLWRLLEPYGESSPMGLAWTFLGFSTAFGIFMGLFETLGGLLLLFRRTTLLGTCIATTVVTNVVAINFCFDVPVKIFSSHLLLMCIFLLVIEGKRLLAFFFLNKTIPPADFSPIFRKKKWLITRKVLKGIFIFVCVVFPIVLLTYESREYGESDLSPLYGVYEVQSFVRNGENIPPLTTDSTRWSKLLLEDEGYITIADMTGKRRYGAFEIDTISKTAVMYSYRDTARKYVLNYSMADSVLTLNGVYKGDTLAVTLRQWGADKFLLVGRGFHWINEVPYNR